MYVSPIFHIFVFVSFILLNANPAIDYHCMRSKREHRLYETDQFVIEIFVWNHREMFSVKLIRDIIEYILYPTINLRLRDSQPFSQYSTVIPTFTLCHSCDGTSTPWNRCTISRKIIHASTNQEKCMRL